MSWPNGPHFVDFPMFHLPQHFKDSGPNYRLTLLPEVGDSLSIVCTGIAGCPSTMIYLDWNCAGRNRCTTRSVSPPLIFQRRRVARQRRESIRAQGGPRKAPQQHCGSCSSCRTFSQRLVGGSLLAEHRWMARGRAWDSQLCGKGTPVVYEVVADLAK